LYANWQENNMCKLCRYAILVAAFAGSFGPDAFAWKWPNLPETAGPTAAGPLVRMISAGRGVQMEVIESVYGQTSDGQEVRQFECRNAHGNSMTMITYGATMTSLMMPDRSGHRANLILTCPDIDAWQKCTSYFGCSVGRFCNRIKEGRFTIAGQPYELAVNNGPNHLHGGNKGFDKVVWQAEPVATADAVGVRFRYLSPDGEEGYPGNLTVTAEYLLTNDDELSIEFRAVTDKVTPVNLTNHNYWNLAGHDSGNHFNQELQIEADQYLVTDATLIPTGELRDVAGSDFDFLGFRKIGERVRSVGEEEARGYDLCYVLRDAGDQPLRLACTARDPESGRVMQIFTTQPGLQFYTGNWLDGSDGSGGYPQYSGYCLETQHYPDSPNQESFPSTLLNPGDELVQKTVHRFSVR
jgi:aldose 1-epimerase